MPRKPNKMGERLDVLEEQMGEVRSTLEALALQMQRQSATIAEQMQQQSLVLSELSKQIGQKTGENVTESEKSVGDHSNGESRLSGK